MVQGEFEEDETLRLEDIIYEKKKNIARITINRPDRLNAVRMQTTRELLKAFEAAEADDTVGVIVLTGKGDRSFSAGGDLKEFAESSPYLA